MCGIALTYAADGSAADPQRIHRMTETLGHRGPDGSGTLIRGNAALGHTRLSIVDVAGGAQPMTSSDLRYTIVFNGEIYNYRALRDALCSKGAEFTSQSDTEVILQLYQREGANCVQRLRGMFSFAIYDACGNSVFVARDRLGIKPLVYYWNGTILLVASEIKALFAAELVAPQLCPSAIKSYFSYQFAISPQTPFKDIYELPAGFYLTVIPGGQPHLVRYWDLEFPREQEYETLDESYWARELETALYNAAACHTIGDVPIGAYLSGGIDSATTTWLLTQCYDRPVQSFSIHFSNSTQDESRLYRAIAAHLGVGNSELLMDDLHPGGYLTELVDAMFYLEQPQRMAVDIPFFLLSRHVRELGYKVVYSGEGADEVLGGYDCFRQDYMRLWGNDVKDAELRALLYFSQYTQSFSNSQIHLLYDLHATKLQQSVIDRFGCYPVWYDFWQITGDMLPGLFHPDFIVRADAEDPMAVATAAMKPYLEGRHRLNQSLYIETKTRLPGWILWRSDRMAMAHGVEARVPFLDHPLTELIARIPPGLKLRGMDEKYLLKKIAAAHLPAQAERYKKRAFYTPIREWLFTETLGEALDQFLSTSALIESQVFEPSSVHRLRGELLRASTPRNADEYYRVMKLEWILTLVLTVQILYAQFVKAKQWTKPIAVNMNH